jgi:hypothetical protein
MRYIVFIFLVFFSSASWANDVLIDSINLDEDSFTKPLTTWFHPEICATNPGEFIYISIGYTEKTIFKIQRSLYEQALPTSFNMSKKLGESTKIQINKTAGCPETPLAIARIQLNTPHGIDGNGVILTLSSNMHDANLIKLRDSGTCPKTESGLIHCSGNQTINGVRQPVEYFMAENISDLQNSGGPMRAKCMFFGSNKRICTISDTINSGVSYETILKDEPTLKNIHALHEQLELFIKTIRAL